jgi:hypothetical protein
MAKQNKIFLSNRKTGACQIMQRTTGGVMAWFGYFKNNNAYLNHDEQPSRTSHWQFKTFFYINYGKQ